MKLFSFAAVAVALCSVVTVPACAQTPAATDDAVKMMVGKPAPSFTLPDQNDKPRSLADNKGKWVVMAFYPADMTTGCTFQNRSYTATLDKFAPLNAVVYTVSTQNTSSKREFCSKEGLKHTLLSDTDGKVGTAYGVVAPNSKYARRWTYYISPDGKIAAIDTKPRVQSAGEDSIAMLKQLQAQKPAATEVKTAMLDASAPTFTLPEAGTGKEQSLASLMSGKKATVLIWVSTQCPVSNAYNERMVQLAQKYGAKGVQFVGINSNASEASDTVASHAKSNDFVFPVLKDPNNKIADTYNARVTPEVYLIDDKGMLVFHGPIDDNQNGDRVTKRYLTDALDAVVAGKPVSVKAARAFGCGIKRAAQ